ncbi:MAG: ribose-phosphate pyrophosphokinase [Syntrophobacteraceae bacterium]|nr:ribose-phosphate pyrophosphokinase [Syntrophobacteraceae bacterium]
MAVYGMKVFAGNSNPALVRSICEILEIPLGKSLVGQFSDGEIRLEIAENVRGADVFVIQSGAAPVNDNLMELLVMIDACKRSSAHRVTAVMPYYCYARQDRKNKPRVPITARLVADLITRVGADRIVTMDLHAGQIQGFFNVPVDNLYASSILLPYIKENFHENLVIVSPDAGGVPRARAYAKLLKGGLAMIDKRRSDPNKAEALNIIGDVEDKTAVILDDMVDTAGTLVEATRTLLERGAKEVYACATHAVLSGPAVERIQNSALKSLIVTDTLPLREEINGNGKIRCVSAARLFAQAIRNIHNEDSISTLFEILH